MTEAKDRNQSKPNRRREGADATPRSFVKRGLPWIVGVALVGLIVIGLWPKPVFVETSEVTRGDMLVTVNEEGRTQVRNRYVITSPVAGQLRRITHKAGASAHAGDSVLAVLETAASDILDSRSLLQAQARVRAAESARDLAAAQQERARASSELASADFERAKELLSSGTLSRQEFDTASMRAVVSAQEDRAAGFALQISTFELEQARALLQRESPGQDANQRLEIVSPVDGRVLRVFQESARVVPAGFPILEVGDPADLEVIVEVLSRDGVAIAPGARVMLEQWGGTGTLDARVRWVEPSAFTKFSALGVEEQRVNVIADLVSPLSDRATLGDGFRVEARIVTWEGKDVLKVPAGAVFQRGGQWRAFLVRGGRATAVEVAVGRANGREVEIRSGVSEGDRLIVYPGDKVRDGSRVRTLTVVN